MRWKRGQQIMGMPFGMIFSIILIVVFIVIAFIAVKYFLNIGESSSVGLFYRELQDTVDEALSEQSTNIIFKIDLPSGVNKVCFANLSASITGSQEDYAQIKNYNIYEANTFLLPPEEAQNMQWKLVKHIDIAKITENKNPYCVPVSKNLKITKGFYDRLVTIE